jgi:hypothetical protein
LEQYIKKQGALYKDLALLELAISLIEKGDVAAAHQKIALSLKNPLCIKSRQPFLITE